MIALGFTALLATAQASSVLLVTVDTFRGDFLGTERVATPHLEALATRGTLFARARAPVPLTLPSHASLFTGLYPPQHGVRDNATQVLGDRHRTLAEVLVERGFQTGAFVASFVLDRRFGLAQGFDHYDDDTVSGIGDLESPEAERRGEDVVAAFEAWLSTIDRERPFFAWVHLYDPHAPYEPPEPYRTRYASDPYAGEIAYTDAVIGTLVDSIDPQETLVVVTGDHGEGLGEHEEATHALLIYNSTLHVPMIVAGPGVTSGKRVDRLVRTIDLPVTILDYLGIDETLGIGVSTKDDRERTAYSESLYGLHHLGWSPLYGLETSTHRFIDAPQKELYVLADDSGETTNVLEKDRATSRVLFRELNELRDGLGTVNDAARTLDAETARKLQSLGYMTNMKALAAGPLADPKQEIDTYQRVQRAQVERNLGDCPRALDTLAEIREPIPLVYEIRAQCLTTMENWDAAARVLREAIELGFETSSLHLNLGIAAFHQGRLDDAEKELRVAIAFDANNVSALYQLGNVMRAKRRDGEAIEAYRAALAINAQYVYAWNGLGMALARSGKNADALDAFRRASETAAAEPRAIFNLALQLERMGKDAEALETYRRYVAISNSSEERGRARAAIQRLERK